VYLGIKFLKFEFLKILYLIEYMHFLGRSVRMKEIEQTLAKSTQMKQSKTTSSNNKEDDKSFISSFETRWFLS
jgi:hypothetical protein